MNSLATLFYPTANRASGLSWVSAIGKIGAVFGSMIGGYIIAARWTIASQCTAFALPMLLVALCVSFIFRYRSLQKFTRASETEGSQNLQ
jgi:AAHS family 4-hydroxybenzoate transporter-like MFS transporter